MRDHDKSRLARDVIVYLAINALAWVLQTTLVRGLARVGQDVVLGLREDLFDHLTQLSLRYFSQQKAGWIIARLTSDVDALSDVLSQGLTTLVVNTLTLLAAIVGLFVLDWRLGLVALVILPPTLVLTRWFQVRSHAAFLRVRETISSMTAQIAESVSGMAVIQAFNRERAFLAEFDTANAANRQTNTHAQYLNSLFFPGIEFARRDRDGRRCSGSAATCSATARSRSGHCHRRGLHAEPRLPAAAGALRPLRAGAVGGRGDGEDQPASSTSSRRSATRPTRYGMPRIDGDLHLDRVTFAYGREPVLHAIDIHVPAGRLPRARRRVGRRQVDDREARRALLRPGRRRGARRRPRPARASSCARTAGSSASCCRTRSCSPGTIADNIRFAQPDATDEQVADVAHAVGVDRIARRFENGLLHEVREGGAGLSAGERQLISIARALLADPRILILDEATSNIDRPTEILIEQALDRLLRGRTSIIIAHRLATVRRADEILVLEHGRISQRGRFDELLATEGPFRELAAQLHGVVGPACSRRR